jgi:hypothetical protein
VPSHRRQRPNYSGASESRPRTSNNDLGGKRLSSRIPKGNVRLKTALVEAAHCAARTKGTYLRDKFYRVKARRGYKRAAVMVPQNPGGELLHAFRSGELQRTRIVSWFVELPYL